MKTFKVSVSYEEGFCLWVKAENEEQAEKLVLADVEMYAGVYESMDDQHDRTKDKHSTGFDTVHRDYFIVDITED